MPTSKEKHKKSYLSKVIFKFHVLLGCTISCIQLFSFVCRAGDRGLRAGDTGLVEICHGVIEYSITVLQKKMISKHLKNIHSGKCVQNAILKAPEELPV